jgi:hypothetical protein
MQKFVFPLRPFSCGNPVTELLFAFIQRVRRYLRSHGVRKGLWYDPEGRHGQPLIIGGRGHTKIMRWLQEPER